MTIFLSLKKVNYAAWNGDQMKMYILRSKFVDNFRILTGAKRLLQLLYGM